MKRYALILTALVLSLSLVADGAFAQRGGRGGGGGGGRAGGGAGSSVNRSPSMSRPSTPSASRPSAPSNRPSTRPAPSAPSRPSAGQPSTRPSTPSRPSAGQPSTRPSTPSRPSAGQASGHSSRGRSRHASLNAECRHPSEHRPRQDPEWNRCRCRTAARHARLVQARCLAVAQHAPRTTNRQSTPCATRR